MAITTLSGASLQDRDTTTIAAVGAGSGLNVLEHQTVVQASAGPTLRPGFAVDGGNGDVVFIDHKWFATVDADNAAFGWKEGKDVTLDAASLFVIRGV